MKNKPAYLLRVALDESRGHHVHVLPCGAVGTVRSLFGSAKMLGFDGHESTFSKRLQKSGGRATLTDLSKPTNKLRATKGKAAQSEEVMDAIRALDARKAAMR